MTSPSLSPFATLLGLALAFPLGCGGTDDAGNGSGTESTDVGDGPETTAPTSGGPDTSGADGSEATGPNDDTTEGPDPDTGGSTGAPPVECLPIPACDAPPPNAGPLVDWEHFESTLVTASGGERHRGRDMFYNPGDAQWVMGKFAYGPTDWDLSGERVDLFLLRGCEGDWEPLGPVVTTFDDEHATVEGVVDSGGWVYFEIPPGLELGLGRHRIHMVVRGDGSSADTYLEIVEPGTPIILSDIDGTLTTGEWERAIDFLLNTIPDINPGAPEAFHALVDRGYRPMYLTARPEFLGNRTYDFVEQRGLPPGIIHTTLSFTGAMGTATVSYKTEELAVLAGRGLLPVYVFGNSSSDADAYHNAGILPLEDRIFYQYEDVLGGRTIDDYFDLVPEFEALDPVCR
jgi:hypothetical protein